MREREGRGREEEESVKRIYKCSTSPPSSHFINKNGLKVGILERIKTAQVMGRREGCSYNKYK
jgi:hypothetical protein